MADNSSTSILDSLIPSGAAPAQAQSSNTAILDSLVPQQAQQAQQAAPSAPTPSAPPQIPDWARVPARQPTPQAAPQQPSLSNIGGAVPSGLYSGVVGAANLPTAAYNAVAAINNGLGGERISPMNPPINDNPMGYQPVGGAAESIYNASKAAGGALALGPEAKLIEPLLPAGSAPALAAKSISDSPVKPFVAASAAGGGAEGPAASMVPDEYKPFARLGANIAAVGGLGLGQGLGSRLLGAADPYAAALAKTAADRYGIQIRAGQLSDNRTIRTADSVLKSVPLSGHAGVDDAQHLAWQKAVASAMGEDADRFTPDVMSRAANRIGGVLTDVENRNSVSFDQPLLNDFANIESNARGNLTDQEYSVVQRQLSNIIGTIKPGDTISGQTYGNLIHKGAPLDRMIGNANGNIASYGQDIKSALQDSLQRSLSGEDSAAYQQARSQWKAMKTIEPLTMQADTVGGVTPSTGNIKPGSLLAAVNKSYSNLPRTQIGDVPLNDLAQIGQRFLKEVPTSHTSERGSVMRWIERGGALAGGLVGGEHYLGLPASELAVSAAAAATGGALLARGAGSALRSKSLANHVIDNSLGNQHPNVGQQIAVPLLTNEGVRQIEPPQEPSVNPKSGLPEFSLKAAQNNSRREMASDFANRVASGDLADHGAMQKWVDANKRDLRKTFGGQGIQNMVRVASLLRRNNDPTAATMFGAAARSGIKDASSLATEAILSPDLAKLLATRVSGNLTNAARTRLIAALQGGSDGSGNDRTAVVRSGVVPNQTTGDGAGRNQENLPAAVAA